MPKYSLAREVEFRLIKYWMVLNGMLLSQSAACTVPIVSPEFKSNSHNDSTVVLVLQSNMNS